MLRTTQLNHVAIHVTDVERSCAWYERALRLERIARPNFNFPGAWFRLGADQELHLIGRRDPDAQPITAGSRSNHYALMTDDMDAAEAYLQGQSIDYLPRRTRPDGAYQIYLTDPDGHVIELCTPPGAARTSC